MGSPVKRAAPTATQTARKGGCALTTVQELGATIINFGGGTYGSLFRPANEEGR